MYRQFSTEDTSLGRSSRNQSNLIFGLRNVGECCAVYSPGVGTKGWSRGGERDVREVGVTEGGRRKESRKRERTEERTPEGGRWRLVE